MILFLTRKNSLIPIARTSNKTTARTGRQFIQKTSYHPLPHFPADSDLLRPFPRFLQWNRGYGLHLVKPFRVAFLLSSIIVPWHLFLFEWKVSWPKTPRESPSTALQTHCW